MKLATVLIALYKASSYLPSKLSNLLQQTVFNDCWIVLLNCCDLEKESEIYNDFRKFPNVKIIEYSQHINLYPTWNDGIKTTDSKYILNSNVDDQLHPKYIEKCCDFLNNNNHSIVSSQVLMTSIPNQTWPHWDYDDRFPIHIYPLSTAGPCPVWKRSLHDKYGYFKDYAVIGDARMWESWLAGGEKFGMINEDLVLYYRNSHSLERRRHDNGELLRDIDLASD